MIKPPFNLKCEYLINPICIDIQKPRFSWHLTHNLRNQTQSAYHIIVSSNRNLCTDKIGDIWDTGKVESEININVPYEGIPLSSDRLYFWRVKWWDRDGIESRLLCV